MEWAKLHIGTSGWSYKHWAEIFYPKDLKPDKYLEFYITRFSCVELNSCFYHLPLKSTATGWMNRTPENLKFCPKLNRYITHQQQLVNVEGALTKFFNVFDLMREKLGPVLIQLPPALNYHEHLITGFFNLLAKNSDQYRFAVEVRNKTWINDKFFNILSQYGIAFVIADSGSRYPYCEAVTADFVYLRFHGREQLYASDYNDAVLWEYGEKIKKWRAQSKTVWVFFNNDYHGFAIKNAIRLIDLLKY